MEYHFSLGHLAGGIVLVSATVSLQLLAQVALFSLGKLRAGDTRHPLLQETPAIVIAVLVLLAGMLLQVFLWALLYYFWGELGGLFNCVYFSFASYTTLGASELSLSPPHRLAGALESAMGMLMFGWSTALLVRIVNRTSRDPAN
jgi:hypothetical protein